MALSHNINGTRRGGGAPVYICALLPKHSLSLPEDKCSPKPMAGIPDVTILGTGKDRDKTFVW